MRPLLRVLALCLTATALIHCDDSTRAPDDGGADQSVNTVDLAPTGLTACLDRPDDQLLRPPGNTLPCELIPPGLTL